MSFKVRNEMVPSMTTLYVDVTCERCGKEPRRQTGINPAESMQYDNALILRLSGGYGMFTDPMEDVHGSRRGYDPETTWVLCHECAHELADWLGVDVHNWHTHVPPEFGGDQHPDHHDKADNDE